MRADLHIHTYYSDGKHTPAEIARMAKESGVDLISMTDHDSMDGMEEKEGAARACGLLFVRGWEVSAYAGCKVHVLGYQCRKNAIYDAFLRERKEGALLRAEDILKKANAFLGIHVTIGDAIAEMAVKDSPIHTMHIVRAVAKAAGEAPSALYTSLFDVGKPAYSEIGRPSPYDALEVIHGTGGIAVLAHPARIGMGEEEKLRLMDSLTDRGLDGIETIHSQHTPEETEYFGRYARERGLLTTGGSDFHAEGSPRKIGLPPFEPGERLLSALALRPTGSE